MKTIYNLINYYKKNLLISLILSSVLLCFSIFYIAKNSLFSKITTSHKIRTSSPEGGSYYQAINELFAQVNLHSTDLGFKLDRIEYKSTGSLQTLEQISNNTIDLGLIQGNVITDKQNISSIAQLYSEIYLFFTNKNHTTLKSLCNQIMASDTVLRVGSLGKGSQVYLDLFELLNFYGCPNMKIEHYPMNNAAAKQALELGQIDLAFMVAGYKNETVRDIAQTKGINILNLDNKEALMKNIGGLNSFDLPVGLLGFGIPKQKVSTISTPAVLLISNRLEHSIVYDLSNFIIQNKEKIELGFPQFDIKRPPISSSIKIHPGATKAFDYEPLGWLNRHEFLIKTIFSLIGVIIAIISIILQVWKFAKEHKK